MLRALPPLFHRSTMNADSPWAPQASAKQHLWALQEVKLFIANNPLIQLYEWPCECYLSLV